MATRRHDPDRRNRIIEKTLEVIAENGVAGTTHRKVARRADVPLGSMTYHFADLDELLREALTLHAMRIAERHDARLSAAATLDELIEAIVDFIHVDVDGSPHELVLTLELYTLAARQPAFRAITHAWMQQSRRALERFVDAETAFDVDAIIEGLYIHASLDQLTRTRDSTARAIRRLLG